MQVRPELPAPRIQTGRGEGMKLSARNILPGKVMAVEKGQTTAHVKIEIAAGVVVTASITNEAVDDLRLKTGDTASAIIKASDVMVAK
jgi:molybdopterin-binding protein